jgi:hypothetical protein
MSVQDEQSGDERSEDQSREDERGEEHGDEHHRQPDPQPGEVANLPPPPLVPVGLPPHEAPDEDRTTEDADRDEQGL